MPPGKTKGRSVRRPAKAPPERTCCPTAGALVTLEIGDPIDEGALSFGFRRTRGDGTFSASEYVEPYGYVIPKGKCLVVTDLAYYSRFTHPEAPGDLTRIMLGLLTVAGNSWSQGQLFVAAPSFSQNGSIGGNVTMQSGFVISHGHYLTVSLLDSELVATYIYVYGYLDDL
jgi:hypothetical protein